MVSQRTYNVAKRKFAYGYATVLFTLIEMIIIINFITKYCVTFSPLSIVILQTRLFGSRVRAVGRPYGVSLLLVSDDQ